jgi:hypothetical protein
MDHSVIWLWRTGTREAKTETKNSQLFFHRYCIFFTQHNNRINNWKEIYFCLQKKNHNFGGKNLKIAPTFKRSYFDLFLQAILAFKFSFFQSVFSSFHRVYWKFVPQVIKLFNHNTLFCESLSWSGRHFKHFCFYLVFQVWFRASTAERSISSPLNFCLTLEH